MNVHYSVALDTFGGMLPDGSAAVGLVFTDKETRQDEAYPLPLDLAEDLGNELIRLAKEMKAIKGS